MKAIDHRVSETEWRKKAAATYGHFHSKANTVTAWERGNPLQGCKEIQMMIHNR
jgi:hypothetical protein